MQHRRRFRRAGCVALLPVLLGACVEARRPQGAQTTSTAARASSRQYRPDLERAQELTLARDLRDGRQRVADPAAALGHFFLAASLAPELRLAGTTEARSARALAETAAFEGAALLRQLRPQARDEYAYLMRRAGLRGLVALTEQHARDPEARALALQAVAAYDGSEQDRAWAERAALLAGSMLEAGTFGARYALGSRFLYGLAGAPGAERLQNLRSPLAIVKQRAAPRSDEALGPRTFSWSVDADALASELFARPMAGKLVPLFDDSKQAGDYLLAAQPAQWDFRAVTNEPFLIAEADEGQPSSLELVRVALHAEVIGKDGPMVGPTEAVAVELLGAAQRFALPRTCTSLEVPESADDAIDSERSFAEVGERGRPLTVGERGLLVLELRAAEGYSGGGASFTGGWLLRVAGDTLNDAGCFVTGDQRVIAGEWQPDGSRLHDEYLSAWQLRMAPGQKQTKDAPRLVFESTADGPPRQRFASYDPAQQRYVLTAPGRASRYPTR